ncbi:MAG: hypothetical protein AAFO91_16970 [Bacteroidota bacterium]
MRILALASLLLFCLACQSDPTNDWVEHDLMAQNLAVSVQGPDSVQIKSNDLSGISRDVSLRNTDVGYYLQIFSSLASTSDLARLKAEQLELVRENPFFERIVQEDPSGFIFESRIDTVEHYGFRYVHYKGDREFIFQNGLGHIFSLEEIERMYTAVDQGR